MKKKNRKLAGKPTRRERTNAAVATEVLSEAADKASEAAVATLEPTEPVEAAGVTETPEAADVAAAAEAVIEAAEAVAAEDEPSGEEVPEDEDAPKTDEAPTDEAASKKEPSKRRRMLTTVATALLATLGVALMVSLGVFAYAASPYSSEIGKEVYHPAEALPFCKVDGVDEINTNKLGKYEVRISFFDLFSVKSHITVRDTVAPRFSVRSLAVAVGTPLVPEDLVANESDMTKITYEFIEGSKIRATDEGGNTTTVRYDVTYVEELRFDDIEAGTPMSEVADMLEATGGLAFSKLPLIDTKTCGVYKIMCRYNGMDTLFALRVVDTTPPTVTLKTVDLLLGQAPTPEAFIADISDVSDTRVSFSEARDFDVPGLYDVTVVVEDKYKNRTELVTQANVLPIPMQVNVEAGSNAAALGELIRELGGAEFPKVPDDLAIEALPLGNASVEIIGEYSPITLGLTVVDTTAPSLTVRNISVLTGKLPRIADIVTDCTDVSPFKLEFASLPDTTVEGSYTVTVIATDSSGNSTEASATLRVSKDSIPPVIHGVKNIVAYEGASVSYRSGVYAVDDNDGTVTVNVDTSLVNASVAGVYKVTYTATDSDGNTAKKTASVTIRAVTAEVINELADAVLSKITTANMSPREKARAIYDWCRVNIRYSTSTSHLMGHFNKAAYSGFTRHYGNCYTYYAVASALLTRAGIENIEIHRNSTTNPHYWNLVKMDGAWYHLDTCPQPAGHRLEVFLLKDAEVRAFTLAYYYNFDLTKFPATPK